MTASSGIRIGNDERAVAMKALDEHMAAGRLDPDEYGQRVARASVARTREGLEELFVDLPEPHAFPAPAPQPTKRAAVADGFVRRVAGQSTAVRILVLLIVGVLAIVALPFIAVGALLVFVVLPVLGCGGMRGRRGWYGPAGRRW